MTKVLITGANGLLGQQLTKRLLQKNIEVLALSKGQCRFPLAHTNFKYYEVDITQATVLQKIVDLHKPDIVVHAAAMTQVDACELEKELCYQINVEGTASVMEATKSIRAFLIHVSTDFVFDGRKKMYLENAERKPVNWYGACKLEAEKMVEESGVEYAIVRTCLVYGKKTPGGRDNILTWVMRKLAAGEKIKVVDDQWRTPTYIGDLADGIVSIIQKRATGIFHLSGKDVLTPYQMAMGVAKYLGYNTTLIEKVTADSFTQPAKRPPETGLIISKAIEVLDYRPHTFEEGMKKTLT